VLSTGRIDSLEVFRPDMKRKLTVILASDVAGYSRLVHEREEETIASFRQAAAELDDLVREHNGRVFNTAGDAILAEFSSAVSAVRCAVRFQTINDERNALETPSRRVLFRMGLAIGDVMVTETGDLLGDAVNVAARLQILAEPGGICVSDDVQIHAARKMSAELTFRDIGEQSLRNIDHPVRAFRLKPKGADEEPEPAKTRSRLSRGSLAVAISAGTIVIAAVFVAFWYPGYATWTAAPPGKLELASVDKQSRFDPARVPLVDDAGRIALAEYVKSPDVKALAISAERWATASGQPDAESAKREALERCRHGPARSPCRIYSVGMDVLWQPPARRTADAGAHVEPLDIPLVAADLPVLTPWMRGRIEDHYLGKADHRAAALSVSRGGLALPIGRGTRGEAIRLAMEKCEDFRQVPCLLVSVDGFLTVQVPKSRPVTGLFVLAAEPGLSDADRDRLAEAYRAPDWRAVVRGVRGGWHVVGGKASEAEAVDAAIKSCSRDDEGCRIYAIGNFRVSDQQ